MPGDSKASVNIGAVAVRDAGKGLPFSWIEEISESIRLKQAKLEVS